MRDCQLVKVFTCVADAYDGLRNLFGANLLRRGTTFRLKAVDHANVKRIMATKMAAHCMTDLGMRNELEKLGVQRVCIPRSRMFELLSHSGMVHT